jgi:hypothetical protein
VVDEVDRLSDLVSDAQRLIEHAEDAQEAFRVGDVAEARRTLTSLAELVAGIGHEVGALLDDLPRSSSSA